MQGSAGCLFSDRGPINSEEDLIANGGPSPMHSSIMVQGIPEWSSNDLKVIMPNCPDVSHDSSSAEYASAIEKIIQKLIPLYQVKFLWGSLDGQMDTTR